MASLEEQLAALMTMSPAQLRHEWRRVHQAVASPRLTTDLLVRGIAYRLQERAYGGLPAATIRELDRVTAQLASGADPSRRREVRLRPGTRLVRSWQERTYTVLVTAEGYVMGDRQFTSLSQIAKAITGTEWSGPRFFGLGERRKKHSIGVSSDLATAHAEAAHA